METKPKKKYNSKVRVTVNLFDGPADNFLKFKESIGALTDSDAARQLITQRLVQLRRSGKLAA